MVLMPPGQAQAELILHFFQLKPWPWALPTLPSLTLTQGYSHSIPISILPPFPTHASCSLIVKVKSKPRHAVEELQKQSHHPTPTGSEAKASCRSHSPAAIIPCRAGSIHHAAWISSQNQKIVKVGGDLKKSSGQIPLLTQAPYSSTEGST